MGTQTRKHRFAACQRQHRVATCRMPQRTNERPSVSPVGYARAPLRVGQQGVDHPRSLPWTLGEIVPRCGPHGLVLPGIAHVFDTGNQVAMTRQCLRQCCKAKLGGRRAMANHNQTFDHRRRCTVDGHGLRKRSHGNHTRRIKRGVIQREVGRLVTRLCGGEGHVPKTCFSRRSGRHQQGTTGRQHDKRNGMKTRFGRSKHDGETLGVGWRFGDEQAQCPVLLARCRTLCDETQIGRCQTLKSGVLTRTLPSA